MKRSTKSLQPGFAVWITGLPASGKSTLAAALARELASRGTNFAVLESDVLRRIFTPAPRYDEAERDVFYGGMAYIGRLLTEHGVSVIFDATAIRRSYRDRARRQISRFLEVYVDCPLSVCAARDPKGIYRSAREGAASGVPGVQAEYEPPLRPDVVVRGDGESPGEGARRIVARLIGKGYLTS
ncbi:MAG: adenylyl-sulfate kinase [Deltaproteobacteria bacterium]|nr:adenylyl-sulfate kinase [Deltaproteobacteria bacterium]